MIKQVILSVKGSVVSVKALNIEDMLMGVIGTIRMKRYALPDGFNVWLQCQDFFDSKMNGVLK